MADSSLIHDATVTPITWQLELTATDTTLTAGRQSTFIDATSFEWQDYIIGGTIVGPASGQAAGKIEIWLYGSNDGVRYSGPVTGTDSALTIPEELKGMLRQVTTIQTTTVPSQQYDWGPYALTEFFTEIPPRFGLWGAHSAGANLTSSVADFRGTFVRTL